jgi:hypothetical protein
MWALNDGIQHNVSAALGLRRAARTAFAHDDGLDNR